MNRHAIIRELNEAAEELLSTCARLSEEAFVTAAPGKWTPAQQLQHLITATDTARMAYTLPRFIVRMLSGRPNRESRTYEQLLEKYKTKLATGGKASGVFIPRPIRIGKQQALLASFKRAIKRFTTALENDISEDELDQYLAPHPLLGKITLRELGYFTILHTRHHHQTILTMASLS